MVEKGTLSKNVEEKTVNKLKIKFLIQRIVSIQIYLYICHSCIE